MLNRISVEEIIKRNGNKCFVCGKELSIREAQIHHLISKKDGGSDDYQNLALVCPEHNWMLGSKTFLKHFEFQSSLVELLKKHESFRNVTSEKIVEVNKIKRSIDIYAEELINNEWYNIIIETKVIYSFTKEVIEAIVNQTKLYKSLFNHPADLTKIKTVFACPGSMAQEAREALEKADIEIWDIEFLAKHFRHQITSISNIDLKIRFLAILGETLKTRQEELIEQLKSCPPGKNDWLKYQKLVGLILEELFCPTLAKPIPELSDLFRVNRRDFILPNYAEKGFWAYLRSRYMADYIVVDAKNYQTKIKKKEALQIANYLKNFGAGLFGIIVSRNGADSGCMHTIREIWLVQQKLLIVLTDSDIEQMLLNHRDGIPPESVIQERIEAFRLSL